MILVISPYLLARGNKAVFRQERRSSSLPSCGISSGILKSRRSPGAQHGHRRWSRTGSTHLPPVAPLRHLSRSVLFGNSCSASCGASPMLSRQSPPAISRLRFQNLWSEFFGRYLPFLSRLGQAAVKDSVQAWPLKTRELRGCPTHRYLAGATCDFDVRVQSTANVGDVKRARRESKLGLVRRGGGQKSTASGASYRLGSHAEIFFWSGEVLNIFLEIKEFKWPCVCARETSGVAASTWTELCARSGPSETALRGFIFRACLRPGGWSKLRDSEAGTVGLPRAYRREIPKTFFRTPELVAGNTENCREIGGGGVGRRPNGNMK
jgi:hypothetical protein